MRFFGCIKKEKKSPEMSNEETRIKQRLQDLENEYNEMSPFVVTGEMSAAMIWGAPVAFVQKDTEYNRQRRMELAQQIAQAERDLRSLRA